MKKVISVLMVIALLLSGCASSKSATKEEILFERLEENIRLYSKDVAQLYNGDIDYSNVSFKEENEIIYFLDENDKILGGVNYAGLDLENILAESPKFKKEYEVPTKNKEMLNTAQKIILTYVGQSKKIHKEDIADITNAINNVELRYGDFTEKYSSFNMITNESTIFINKNLETIIDEYMFMHELIHVINSVTAKGSKNENTYLNHGGLTEGITDILASTIALNYGLDCMETVRTCSYVKFYDSAYILMSKDNFDLLEAYFYPDEYQTLIDMTSETFVKAMFLSAFTFDSTGYSNANSVLCQYYLQQ